MITIARNEAMRRAAGNARRPREAGAAGCLQDLFCCRSSDAEAREAAAFASDAERDMFNRELSSATFERQPKI